MHFARVSQHVRHAMHAAAACASQHAHDRITRDAYAHIWSYFALSHSLTHSRTHELTNWLTHACTPAKRDRCDALLKEVWSTDIGQPRWRKIFDFTLTTGIPPKDAASSREARRWRLRTTLRCARLYDNRLRNIWCLARQSRAMGSCVSAREFGTSRAFSALYQWITRIRMPIYGVMWHELSRVLTHSHLQGALRATKYVPLKTWHLFDYLKSFLWLHNKYRKSLQIKEIYQLVPVSLAWRFFLLVYGRKLPTLHCNGL